MYMCFLFHFHSYVLNDDAIIMGRGEVVGKLFVISENDDNCGPPLTVLKCLC